MTTKKKKQNCSFFISFVCVTTTKIFKNNYIIPHRKNIILLLPHNYSNFTQFTYVRFSIRALILHDVEAEEKEEEEGTLKIINYK